MKKNSLILATALGVCAMAASTLFRGNSCKSIDSNENINESSVDENTSLESVPEKRKNKNIVRVNNSLITIKIKIFSK